jgi:hypothetical protein
VKQIRQQSLLNVDLLLGLFFDTEDGGEMFYVTSFG